MTEHANPELVPNVEEARRWTDRADAETLATAFGEAAPNYTFNVIPVDGRFAISFTTSDTTALVEFGFIG